MRWFLVLALVLGLVTNAVSFSLSLGLSLRPSSIRTRGVDVVALPLRRGGRAASTPLKLGMQMEHPQWPQFVDYNLGKWSGRALHISAENGEYTEPYVKSYSAEVAEDDNSVVETITEIDGKPKPTAATKDEDKSVSMRITGGAGGFDASDDGSYALDRWVTKIPGTDDTARLQIEISIALGKDERVRCQIHYGIDSKLDRVVLREERRHDKGDAPPRDPLNFHTYVGTFQGDAVSRRSWGIGGGWVRFTSKIACLWDQTERIRREITWMEKPEDSAASLSAPSSSPANGTTSKVTWGTIPDPYGNIADFITGDRLILLPGGCWVVAPSVLLTESGTPMPKYNALDTLAFESLDGAESTPDIVDSIEGIKAGLSSASKGAGAGSGGMGGFSVEFGCVTEPGERIRVQRLYEEGGNVASTVTSTEKCID